MVGRFVLDSVVVFACSSGRRDDGGGSGGLDVGWFVSWFVSGGV
jgi:hypothetical protein